MSSVYGGEEAEDDLLSSEYIKYLNIAGGQDSFNMHSALKEVKLKKLIFHSYLHRIRKFL